MYVNVNTQQKMIENRINQCLDDDNFLCPKHKNYLGNAWQPKNKCYHPNHSEPKLKKRKCSLRLISKNMFENIIQNH